MRLTPRDQAIVTTIGYLHQVTSSQIRRLFFADGSPASQGVRQRRTMARLTKWGAVRRIDRAMGGGLGGSGEYTYLPSSSRARTPDMHTLDITEMFVRLNEAQAEKRIELLGFDPEPYCHVQVGHLEIKPDAYIRVRVGERIRRCWLEMDRGTEYRPQLNAKMRSYCKAYSKWPDTTFPQVIYIVPDDLRRRFVESVVKYQEIPKLFLVSNFDQALSQIGE